MPKYYCWSLIVVTAALTVETVSISGQQRPSRVATANPGTSQTRAEVGSLLELDSVDGALLLVDEARYLWMKRQGELRALGIRAFAARLVGATQIAYIDYSLALRMFDLQRSAATTLVQPGGANAPLFVSPDRTRLAYLQPSDTDGETLLPATNSVAVYDLRTATPSVLLTVPNVTVRLYGWWHAAAVIVEIPSWSPETLQPSPQMTLGLVDIGDRFDGKYGDVLVRSVATLPAVRKEATYPTTSYDQRWLAYEADQGVVVVSVDEFSYALLPQDGRPAWTTEGLSVIRKGDFVRIEPAALERQPATAARDLLALPAKAPQRIAGDSFDRAVPDHAQRETFRSLSASHVLYRPVTANIPVSAFFDLNPHRGAWLDWHGHTGSGSSNGHSYDTHAGTDYHAAAGGDVFAAQTGIVSNVTVDCVNTYPNGPLSLGTFIDIDHGTLIDGHRYRTRYGHVKCDNVRVTNNSTLSSLPTHIAEIGKTGYSSQSLTHFGVFRDNALVDPYSLGIVSDTPKAPSPDSDASIQSVPAALPSGWTSQDIGTTGVAGSAVESGGTFTLRGGGADVWDTTDAFHYAYRSLAGDGTIVARVASISGATQAWTKMGVMIRGSTSANAAHAFMLVSSGKGLAFQRRTTSGGLSTHTSGGTGTAPRWVKLVRVGNVITASASLDGANWTNVGSDTFSMPDTVLVGLVAHSHTTSALATAAFDNVNISMPIPPPTLPSGWTSADVGAVGAAGSASESGGTFTLRGGGADVWDTTDAFHYAYRSLTGDGTIVARVASISGATQAWTKMGVMIRGSTSANAAHAFMLVSSGKGLAFQRRTTSGGLSTHTSGGTGTAPRWVKLVRVGNVITASASLDGANWTNVGSDTFSMPDTVLVGLVAHSHTTSALATAAFDNVNISMPIPPPTLPSGWTSADVGAVGAAGSASESGGTFTLRGGGADVWDTTDAFHYAYRSLTGDGTIVARVASISGATQAWTKMGVMIRGSTSANAAHAFMLVSSGKGLAFQRRTTSGGLSTHTSGGTGTAPRWVKLVRVGNVITASASLDGANWTNVGSDTFSMPDTVLVGLVAHSHTTSALATAMFDNVTVTIADSPATVTVSVMATDDSATEGGDTGTFTFSRTGSTTNTLTVLFTTAGTAALGTDYTLRIPVSSVTFAVGESTVTKVVTALNDAPIDPDETVIVTLATGGPTPLGRRARRRSRLSIRRR